jgi:hypothetical protein
MLNQKSSPNNRLKTPLLTVIAVLLLLAVVYLSFYYFGHYQQRKKIKESVNQQEALLNQTTVISKIDTNSPNYIHELDFIDSRSGEITLVNDPDIYIKAKYILNNQFVEKTLKIKTDSSTKFLQYNLQELNQLSHEQWEEAKTEITFKDLKVGDQITAISKNNENIKDKTEFLASKIEKQI